MSPSNRSATEGERTRIRHAIERMRAVLDSLEHSTTAVDVPFGSDPSHALMSGALEIARHTAAHDTYLRIPE